jgi:transposase
MEKEDFRTIDDTVRSSYRKKGIALINKGMKKGDVAILFGVNKNTVSNWVKHYNATGGFKSKKKGVKAEDK